MSSRHTNSGPTPTLATAARTAQTFGPGRHSGGSGRDVPEHRTGEPAGDEDGPRAAQGERRTSRRTRQELRNLLVRVGTEILWEEGLATGAEDLTFKRVFERVEKSTGVRVTHASVIGRIWQNQEEFQTEVLANLAGLEMPDIDAQVVGALSGTGALDRSTAEARWQAVIEVCRLGGEATFHGIVRSSRWPRWMGLWALAVVDAGSPRKRPIVDALLRAEEESTDYYESRYAAAMGALGLRMREPFTVRQLALALDAYAQGCALRAGVDPATSARIERPTGPEGTDEPWTLFAVGLEALVQQFVEIDPEWTAA